MKILFLIHLSLIYLYLVRSKDVCSNFKPLEKFNIQKFSGTWYLIERYMSKDLKMDFYFNCDHIVFKHIDNNTIYAKFYQSVRGVEKFQIKFIGVPPTSAYYIAKENNGVIIPPDNTGYMSKIVSIDYNNYFITWICKLVPYEGSNDCLYYELLLYGRTPEIKRSISKRINRIIDDIRCSRKYKSNVTHKNCTYSIY